MLILDFLWEFLNLLGTLFTLGALGYLAILTIQDLIRGLFE